MSELPAGWVSASLGEITAEPAQRVPTRSEEFTYIDIASVDRDTKRICSPQRLRGDKAPSRARKVVHTGDVIVSMTRPNLNAVALVPPELHGQIASTGFDVLRPIEVEPRWLFSVVRSREFVEAMSALVQGALYPAVRSRDVRAYETPVPPIREQSRIADKLDAVLARVDACRARLDRVPAILNRFREAVLEAAVSGRLTEEWRQRASTNEVNASKVQDGGMPSGWILRQFAEVTESTLYGPRFSSELYIDDGVPTLRTTDMDDRGHIVLRDPPRVAISAEDLERLGLHHNDLILTRTGATIGKCAVYDASIGPALPSAYLIRFRLRESVVVARYALLFLLSPIAKRLFLTGSTAVAQPNINASTIGTFQIPLPAAEEQAEIVRRVDDPFALADGLEAKYRAAVERVERLTSAVSAKAFRGELVPQDPNDEPASVLLEKIREMRTNMPAKKPRGRAIKLTITDSIKVTNQVPAAIVAKPDILSAFLRKRGRMTPEALLQQCGLEIDAFYDQLKLEEQAGLLREVRKGKGDIVRFLEATP